MDKRSFLKSFGRATQAQVKSTQTQSGVAPPSMTLAPYTGPWTTKHALHLLNRATFGPTRDEIVQVQQMGISASVDMLFASTPEPDPPIYHRYDQDPEVAVGETWVDNQPSINGLNNARQNSLTTWMFGNMMSSSLNIKEKMVLFWHEHFPVSDTPTATFDYKYYLVLRNNALGNFRTMMEEITISDSMLLFLNGNENTRQAPNENFARELMELFMLGRGPLAGPGDYTTYTEQDVEEIARALTGWRSAARSDLLAGSSFRAGRHDNGDKVLSGRFDDVVISDNGEDEYKDVIDIILRKREVGYHLARQLHIWFVSAHIDDEVEADIIRPLGDIIFDNDFEIAPALKTLLRSEYFNDGGHRGCIISSPIDFIIKIANPLKFRMSDQLIGRYFVWDRLKDFSTIMQMGLMSLPEVAGWKAYYQEPQYSQYWINAFSLNVREQLLTSAINSVNDAGIPNIDLISFIGELGDAALDSRTLIQGVTEILFPFEISQNQEDYLVDVLLPGLPDYEWGVQYNEYLNDPNNENLRNAVRERLVRLFTAILKMPEFYLI